MRLKKTVAVALATALLATTAAVPAFAAPVWGIGGNSTKKMTVKENPKEVGSDYSLYLDDSEDADTTYTGKSTGVSSGTTTVRYYVTETYAWTIPAVIDFSHDGGHNKILTVSPTESDSNYKNLNSKVVVSTNVIPEGKKLVITAQGDGDNGEFIIKSGMGTGTTSLNYSIYVTEDDVPYTTGDALVAKTGEIVSLSAGNNAVTKTLTFKLNTENANGTTAEIAGRYTGTVTYTATVTNQ